MLLVLGEWWAALAGIEKIFWGVSIIFSVLFFIQFVLSLIGLDFDSDVDMDFDSDVDSGFSTDVSFTVLSVRSFIAFFTFFGWTGVLVLNNGVSGLWAVGFGAIAGIAAMLIVGYMMYLFARLQDDGSVFDPYEALDEVGTVYMKIPAGQQGSGKVQIKLQGSIKEVEAVTRDGEPIPMGTAVRIIDILDEKIMIVEPLDKYLNTGI
ncbi:MAG: hypothetical protein ACJAUH_003102 [Saprospiraceae bacterium]|jgi:hypothetical protein